MTNTSTPNEYRVMFTVFQRYYDRIVTGQKTTEVRQSSKRWLTVANRVCAQKWWGMKSIAVFVCGRAIHRRYIVNVKMVDGFLLFELGEVCLS